MMKVVFHSPAVIELSWEKFVVGADVGGEVGIDVIDGVLLDSCDGTGDGIADGASHSPNVSDSILDL